MAEAQLTFSCDIDAPVEVVWRFMTDFARYANWNPFVVRAEPSETPPRPGSALRLTAQMPIGFRTRTRHEITELQAPTSELSGKLTYVVVGPLAKLVSGYRSQTVEALSDGRTRYRTVEALGGPLRALAPSTQVELGVIRQAMALKDLAERQVQRGAA
jgi:hypothetical protein